MTRSNKEQFKKGEKPHNFGKSKYNHQEIINLYRQYKNATIVAKLIGASSQATITQILRKYNEPIVQPTRNHKCNKYANQIMELLMMNMVISLFINQIIQEQVIMDM
jgi:hypothetical protein